MDESGTKQTALAALSYVVASIKASDADKLTRTLLTLSAYAESMPPGALYAEWAHDEPRVLPLVINGRYTPAMAGRTICGGTAVASASGSRDDECQPSAALAADPSSFWAAPTDAPSSWWQVALELPTFISFVHLTWRWSTNARGLPERYTVSFSDDGGNNWTPAERGNGATHGEVVTDLLPAEEQGARRVDINAMTTHVRVTCSGVSRAVPLQAQAAARKDASSSSASGSGGGGAGSVPAKDRAHALTSVALFVPDVHTAPHVAPRATLGDLELLAETACTGGSQPGAVAAGLTALSSLSLATASTQGLLRMALSLLASHSSSGDDGGARGEGDVTRSSSSSSKHCNAGGSHLWQAVNLGPPALRLPSFAPLTGLFDVGAFQRRLASACDEGWELLLAGAEGELPVLAPRWDSDCKAGNIELSADDALASSTTSTKAHVYGAVGFNRGRAAWELKIERDTQGDECVTAGCGVKPVESSSHDSAANLFMIRGYNGRVTSGGQVGRTVDKFHPGDTLRFELDCEAGEVTLAINGADQGVVFRGLAGRTVFPAACTYSDGRAVRFTKLEAWGAAASSGSEVPLGALGDLAQGRMGMAGAGAPTVEGSGAAAASPHAPASEPAVSGTLIGGFGSSSSSPFPIPAAPAEPEFDYTAFAAAVVTGSGVDAGPTSLTLNPRAGTPMAAGTSASGGSTPMTGAPVTASSRGGGSSMRSPAVTFALPPGTPVAQPSPAGSGSASGSLRAPPLRPPPPPPQVQPLTRIRHEGHVVMGGYLEAAPPSASGAGGASAVSSPGITDSAHLAQKIRVGGAPSGQHRIALRPDPVSRAPALVAFPLSLPSERSSPQGSSVPPAGAAPPKRVRPFEWFTGHVGVDDTSWGDEHAAAGEQGTVSPVVISIYADWKEVWRSRPLSAPGETQFARCHVGGASALTLVARFEDTLPAGDHSGRSRSSSFVSFPGFLSPPSGKRVAPKTVLTTASVHRKRDWAWSSTGRPGGAPPLFVDQPPAPPSWKMPTVAAAATTSSTSSAGAGGVTGSPARRPRAGSMQSSTPPRKGSPASAVGKPPASPAAVGAPPQRSSPRGEGGATRASPRPSPALSRVLSMERLSLPPPSPAAPPAPSSRSTSPAAGIGPVGGPQAAVGVSSTSSSPRAGGDHGDATASGGGSEQQRARRRRSSALRLAPISPPATPSAPNAVLTGGVALASTPLSLARFLLLRLAWLAGAHSHLSSSGSQGAQRISRALGVQVARAVGGGDGGESVGGVTLSHLAALARAKLAQTKSAANSSAGTAGDSGSGSVAGAKGGAALRPIDVIGFTADHVQAVEAMVALQAPFGLDVCLGTFRLLQRLLELVLPRVWAESQAQVTLQQADLQSSAVASGPGVTPLADHASGALTRQPSLPPPVSTAAASSSASLGASPLHRAPSFLSSRPMPLAPPPPPPLVPRSPASRAHPPAPPTAPLTPIVTASPRLGAAASLSNPVTPHFGGKTAEPAAQPAISPPSLLTDAESLAAAERPWAAIAGYLLTIVQAHLRRLVATGVDPASVGVHPAPVGDAAASGKGGAGIAALGKLQSAIAASALANGDVSSSHALTGLGPDAHLNPAAAAALSRRDPRAFVPSLPGGSSDFSLAPLHRLLQSVADGRPPPGVQLAPGSRDDYFPLSLQTLAGEAVDSGLHVFFPTAAQRRHLLASLLSRGGTLEAQLRFPAYAPPPERTGPSAGDGAPGPALGGGFAVASAVNAAGGARDLRLERAALLLQMEAAQRGWQCSLLGSKGGFVHVLVNLPPAPGGGVAASPNLSAMGAEQAAGSARRHALARVPPSRSASGPSLRRAHSGRSEASAGGDKGAGERAAAATAGTGGNTAAVDFLETALARVFARSGLGAWHVPGGCADPQVRLKIERTPPLGTHSAPTCGSGNATPSTGGPAVIGDRSLPVDVMGVIRVFTRSAGQFTDIESAVESSIHQAGSPGAMPSPLNAHMGGTGAIITLSGHYAPRRMGSKNAVPDGEPEVPPEFVAHLVGHNRRVQPRRR